jgi:hypothetical protein
LPLPFLHSPSSADSNSATKHESPCALMSSHSRVSIPGQANSPSQNCRAGSQASGTIPVAGSLEFCDAPLGGTSLLSRHLARPFFAFFSPVFKSAISGTSHYYYYFAHNHLAISPLRLCGGLSDFLSAPICVICGCPLWPPPSDLPPAYPAQMGQAGYPGQAG